MNSIMETHDENQTDSNAQHQPIVQGGTRSPNADETPFGKLVPGFAHELNQRKTATEMNKGADS